MNVKQIFRGFFRDRLNTAVILISLAVGMACINLILLFIYREVNTDNFHKNGSRIYLLKCDNPFEKGTQMSSCRLGGAEYMKENFSQVEEICRVTTLSVQKILVNGETYYDKPTVYEASSNFFNFFTFPLITNNANTVLETESDIAISVELASKYFGNNNPVGKVISLTSNSASKEYIIKGIFRKPAANSMFSFDIVKFRKESERYAFVLLKKGTNPSELEKIFASEKEKIPSINDGIPGQYHLQSLRQTYFDNDYSQLGSRRNRNDLQLALIIGLLVICVGSFNYLGLVNNKLINKTSEFAIRRINGASKASLIFTFMSENLFLIVISYAISLEIISWIIPVFNDLTGSNIMLSNFFMPDGLFITTSVSVFLLLITIFFSYFNISNQSISTELAATNKIRMKRTMIPALNVVQISVSIALLTCSIVIKKQINYISSKDIGLNKEVIEVRLPSQYSAKASVFKEELLKDPSVSMVSVTNASPLLEFWMVLAKYTEDGIEKEYTPAYFPGDESYIGVLGIVLKEGRNFSGNAASDKNNCLINETLAGKFPNQKLVGNKLPGDKDLTVIGIVKDFNFSSLKSTIDPGVIIYDTRGFHLLVRPADGMTQQAVKRISETWKSFIPDYPVDTESVKDRYEWYHMENQNYAKLIGSCCIISLFLSMIGLFAVSYNSGLKRTKEIGIRKINGANIYEVMLLLNKDIVRWVATAFITAAPVAFYAMHKWLQSFAFKTELSWWVFVLSGAIALGITLLTVTWQSWGAARKNPVEALRYE